MKKVKLGLLCLLAGVVLSACNKEKEGYSKKSDYKETAFGMDLSMVYVEGGTFDMGGTPEQGDEASANEKPVHKVTLTSYHIGKYEITQAQWKAVMGAEWKFPDRAGGYKLEGDLVPVYFIDWEEAVLFCKNLSAKTGKKYMLPTEAQWEFAARGGNKSKGCKYSGSNNLDLVAVWGWHNMSDFNPQQIGDSTPQMVGTKAPNELGIYDMSGNVREWCADGYYNYSTYDVTNPYDPPTPSNNPDGMDVVTRGGGIGNPAGGKYMYRVSYRCEQESKKSGITGFRVVCLP